MGRITLTVEGTTVGTVAEGRGIVLAREVSETDSARLLSAYAALYADQWRDEQGERRRPAVKEILDMWWDGVVSAAIGAVQSVEQNEAAERARESVTPIKVT